MSKSAIFMQKNLVISKNSSTFAVRNDERLVFARKSGFSSVGRVHVWGARGRWFESSHPDFYKRDMISSRDYVSLFFLIFPHSQASFSLLSHFLNKNAHSQGASIILICKQNRYLCIHIHFDYGT